jgi:hypothetical protein
MNISSAGARRADSILAYCRQVFARARHEDAAASRAPSAPCWTKLPASAEAHRAAASMLRADAECSELESRPFWVQI